MIKIDLVSHHYGLELPIKMLMLKRQISSEHFILERTDKNKSWTGRALIQIAFIYHTLISKCVDI